MRIHLFVAFAMLAAYPACSNSRFATFSDLPSAGESGSGDDVVGRGGVSATSPSSQGGNGTSGISGYSATIASSGAGSTSLHSGGTYSSGGSPASGGGAGASGAYRCGNGVLEGSEDCDDGNVAAGDGCSSSCTVVCSDFAADASEWNGNHHCYAEFQAQSWEAARVDCKNRGAALVTLNSSEERTFIATRFGGDKWIGASDGAAVNDWMHGTYGWITGEPFDADTWWAVGQPDWQPVDCWEAEPFCYEHCVHLMVNAALEDVYCGKQIPYVCEWRPSP